MKLYSELNRLLTIWYLRRKGVEWEGEPPQINMRNRPIFMVEGRLKFGSGVRIFTQTVRSTFQVSKDKFLVVGDGVVFNNVFTISAKEDITIGRHSGFGPYVSLHSSGEHKVHPNSQVKKAPIHIGRNCAIGEKSIVMPGVTIGDHTFVGALALVDESLPAKVLAVGNPATVKRNDVNEYLNHENWVRIVQLDEKMAA